MPAAAVRPVADGRAVRDALGVGVDERTEADDAFTAADADVDVGTDGWALAVRAIGVGVGVRVGGWGFVDGGGGGGGGGSRTVNVPSVRPCPVESDAVTVPRPLNAAKLAEQLPAPKESALAHRTRPPPVIETDEAPHDPRPELTDTAADTVSPTCAGFGPPMLPAIVHRARGAPAAGGSRAAALSQAPMSTTASTDERASTLPDTGCMVTRGIGERSSST
ncbi:MAG TPA: hypothetical protein VHS54_05440, partial [Jatrophihabitans sp.]|nr:hypothetical protein [Jatrophihabitans sp.]